MGGSMQELEERIQSEGTVKAGNVLEGWTRF